MANMTITNNDMGSVILEGGTFRDETLKFAAADTFAAGTILARQVVSTAVTVVDGATNTGDGTVTASVVAGADVPAAGTWTLVCTGEVAHGGIFEVKNPDGGVEAAGLNMLTASAAAATFEVKGLSLVVTDGAEDFDAGDTWALTVAADGDLVPYATDGAGGAQIPTAVLTHPITSASIQDVAARVMIAGKVRKERLIIDADGDDTNVTIAVLDKLRSVGIIADYVTELNDLDTQD